MSSKKLLDVENFALYSANASSSDLRTNTCTPRTPTPNTALMSAVSISILKCDKSKYFESIRHSDVVSTNIFSKPYNCPKQLCKYCLFYSLCMIILCILSLLTYGGITVFQKGVVRDQYGHSFNINGTCLCISSIKTSYDWKQTWRIWNLTVCDEVKSKDYTFTSQSGTKWVSIGEIRSCYTNAICSRIFTSLTTNVIIDEAIYLYVGSALIFLIAACGCCGSMIYLNSLPKTLGLKMWNVFVGPKDIKTHFMIQWEQNMSAAQRFDYWISYETRKVNIFLGSDSIYELLLQFYDDDCDEEPTPQVSEKNSNGKTVSLNRNV